MQHETNFSMINHNFTIKAEWIEQMDVLSPTDRARVFEAIYNYAVYGKLPADPMILFATAQIRKEIDRARIRRERAQARRQKAVESNKDADKDEPVQRQPDAPEPVPKAETPPQTAPGLSLSDRRHALSMYDRFTPF